MRFSLLQFAVTGLTLCANALAQLTAQGVVDNINILTAKSQALQGPANSITLLNGPLIIIGLGPFPTIINGFADIVKTATADSQAMQSDPQFALGTDSDNIFNAFRDFVYIHQQLLSILIGKAGLFGVVPLIGSPVAAVLSSLESVVDAVALGLIGTVQSHAADIQEQASSLHTTIEDAIQAYEGLV